MQRFPITVTLITHNEEANLKAALESVLWAEDIVLVDSGSQDQTLSIAKQYPVRVFHHDWCGYGQQKNFAQNQARFPWILNIDADERVPEALAHEIQTLLSQPLKFNGFYIPRKNFFLGHWIQYGGWYPNLQLRFAHRDYARWSEPHVHEQWKVQGPLGTLHHPLFHYTINTIEAQVLTNLRFAQLGARDLKDLEKKASYWQLITKPLGKFFETFFFKRGFLDGWLGFMIALNAAYSMFLKYAFLLERNFHERPSHR